MVDYEYILFDLDGTLIDSKPGIVECIRYALDHESVSYTNEILDKMIGPPFRVSMHDFLGQDEKSIEKLIELYRGEYEKYGWKHCEVFCGVKEMLHELKAAGKRLAVATSKPIKFTNMIVKGFDLEKYFDVVDIDGAHICGIDVCAVLYGYGDREEFEKHDAEYIVKTPSDVVSLVLKR